MTRSKAVNIHRKRRYVTVHSIRLVRLLRRPIKRSLTTDFWKADESKYPYGMIQHPAGTVYYISPLSILHRWFGVVLVWNDDNYLPRQTNG